MRYLFISIILFIIVAGTLGLIIYFAKYYADKRKYRKQKQNKTATYTIKQKYITECEQQYFITLKNIIGEKYIIYPQVPLSQIIEKNTTGFHNELFRIIDFCIFDYQMKPLVCIEINDSSHNEYNRYKRDMKVSDILENAGLPLIKLWTSYGIQPDYIRKRLQEHISI